MWEMWLLTPMQPPVAGIFSPSIHGREVAVSRVGLRIDAATVIAHPRFCSSFLTRTAIPPDRALLAGPARTLPASRAGYSVDRVQGPHRHAGAGWENRRDVRRCPTHALRGRRTREVAHLRQVPAGRARRRPST